MGNLLLEPELLKRGGHCYALLSGASVVLQAEKEFPPKRDNKG